MGWPSAAALATAAIVLAADAPAQSSPRPAGPAARDSVVVDGASVGRRFDGLGAVSSGGSSRLLFDYPEAARAQILDYLFRPGYGAALQLLKVEIGGEVNGTVGSEPSHMRERGEVNCDRGYEWWLMEEARRRNPAIKLIGLEWGAPGWLDGGIWSADNITYIQKWLDCAKSRGLAIDYVGGWNESGFNAPWYVAFSDALRQSHPGVKIIAADVAHTGQWSVATAMARDSAFNAATDVVGVHGPGGSRVDPDYLHVISSDVARALGKPLWASELSSLAHDVGAIPLARTFNRAYIDARVTGQMIWTPVSAWYSTLPIADTGPIVAEWPWSGYYDVGGGVWSLAHTTQFTSPGWHYLDRASTRLASGASVVSFGAPNGSDFTVVVEAMDLKAPTTLALRLANLPHRALHLWVTDLGSSDPAQHFRRAGTVTPRDDVVELRLEPRHLYTLSTVGSAGKGTARPRASAAATLPLPFRESFESPGSGRLARYFSDVSGLFETAPCGGGRAGTCYRQMVSRPPNDWHGPDMAPTTIVGDPRWWGDYRVSSAVRLAQGGHVELLGRVDGVGGDEFLSGYHLQLASDGAWRLYSEDVTGLDTTLAAGRVPLDSTRWHTLALTFRGAEIQAQVNGERVVVRDDRHRMGQVGLRASKWTAAEFDDVRVEATAPPPTFVPHAVMTASATSAHAGNAFGYAYPATAAIDDRPETYWRSEWDPAPAGPQSITLDLGAVRDVRALVYRPRISGHWAARYPGNPVTSFDVQVSADGRSFRSVASGAWRATTAAPKVVQVPGATRARYVRLQGGARPLACETSITASEIEISTTPIPDPSPSVPTTPPALGALVPRDEMRVVSPDGDRAIDGDCATTSALVAEGASRSLTIDLGRVREVSGIAYLPPQDATATNAITEYEVVVSDDGQRFTRVASGRWIGDGTPQFSTWAPRGARYVRLVGQGEGKAPPAAAEIHIGTGG